ncbi:MAG: ABC transporter permease [Lachnospiraceae bacterium]|nr:ABC transporter permease [Lachnospiraceae bacterium]
MKNSITIIKNELSSHMSNPAIMGIIILPMIMSVFVMNAMEIAEQDFLLAAWLLFAQAMVGIMITGPNIIEERESKTIDALLCSPLSFGQIVFSKCFAVLILSVISQLGVYFMNRGVTSDIFILFIPITIGGALLILIGAIIGLKVKSSQNGSAVSSITMISLFLVVTVYQLLPEWVVRVMVAVPSVSITEVADMVMTQKPIAVLQSGIVIAWLFVCIIYIKYIEKQWTK